VYVRNICNVLSTAIWSEFTKHTHTHTQKKAQPRYFEGDSTDTPDGYKVQSCSVQYCNVIFSFDILSFSSMFNLAVFLHGPLDYILKTKNVLEPV